MQIIVRTTNMRKNILSRWILAILAGVVVTGWCWFVAKERSVTEIVFLAVGEGDAILITQGSYQVLIDGGRDGKELLYRL